MINDQKEPQVSPQHLEGPLGDSAMKASPEARQAVEVRPMRYVLGLGIVLPALGMALVFIFV